MPNWDEDKKVTVLPTLSLVLKPKRKKMYSVYANFEFDGDIERARFLHPGDAYAYATKLQDDAWTFALRLQSIRCET